MEFEENNIAITIPQYPKNFIYFLIKNNIVVYVGQTTQGILRPFQHKDKDYDEIKIIACAKEMLDFLEDKYIEKYMPKYNQTMNSSMNYSLIRARNKIRTIFNNKIDIRELKKIINNLKIELHVGNNRSCLYKKI